MPVLTLHTFWNAIGPVTDAGPYLIHIETTPGEFIACQRRLTMLAPPGPAPGSKWIKFILFEMKGGELRALQVESRAVDAVPVDPLAGAFYMIRRSDSGLLALPGGFIDPEDGIDFVHTLRQVTEAAAARELLEETGLVADRLEPLGDSVREEIAPGSGQKKREYITRTWPFAAVTTMAPLAPADDAQQAPGSPGLLPGWYRIADGVPAGLHFAHHAKILSRLFSAVASNFGRRRRRSPAAFKGRDLAKIRQLAKLMRSVITRDYIRVAQGKEPILANSLDLSAVDLDSLNRKEV